MKQLICKRCLWLLVLLAAVGRVSAAELKEKLAGLHGISRIDSLNSGTFAEKYVLFIEQPLDHRHPEKGTFRQRMVVSHVGFDRPTVLVTEGYGGSYALYAGYREELSRIYDCNQIFVEHRYFQESTPDPLDWQYLTAENSAYDLHRIFTAFKALYPGKWIGTGVSKGGQTTLIYRTFFPDDMDVSVAYVAPVCFRTDDERPAVFLEKLAATGPGRSVRAFQLDALKRKQTLLPLFEKYCRDQQLTFRIPIEEVYDYSVLELAFSFWQWGAPADRIPGPEATDRAVFDYLLNLSEPSYFARGQSNVPFFVQAARELGYYSYDLKPFEPYLSVRSSKNYLQRIMLPDESDNIKFDASLSKKIRRYLKRNDPELICVYGENDPWTAAGITGCEGKKNRLIVVCPQGSHGSRIGSLPAEAQKEVLIRLSGWLDE